MGTVFEAANVGELVEGRGGGELAERWVLSMDAGGGAANHWDFRMDTADKEKGPKMVVSGLKRMECVFSDLQYPVRALSPSRPGLVFYLFVCLLIHHKINIIFYKKIFIF